VHGGLELSQHCNLRTVTADQIYRPVLIRLMRAGAACSTQEVTPGVDSARTRGGDMAVLRRINLELPNALLHGPAQPIEKQDRLL
jgi:hypothetical protein